MGTNNGGPAFPEAIAIGPAGDVYPGMGGMTLRDWFAGQALMGIGSWCPANVETGSDEWHEARARHAYADADAMLAAREVGGGRMIGAPKHTPGPWKVGPVDDTVVIDATGREVAAIDGDYNDPDTWPLMEANARLIAAAPDMLAALRALLPEGWDDGVMDHMPGVKAARLAIAKAEGATP